jgi:small-conductance mechanosensitive channel
MTMDYGPLTDLISPDFLERLIIGLAFLTIALPLVYLIRSRIRTIVTKKHSEHYGMLAAKIVHYVLMVLVVVIFLTEMGLSLTPLLGAAGVLGVAIGFASQTSVSNIISGFFLIAERPFSVGDVIQVGTTTGVVLSIDTLSAKLRTFDNTFVRIPNEILIKSEVTNITRFPIRRVDVAISVAYGADLKTVRDILMQIAETNPLALQEPAPMVNFQQFGASSVDLKFLVWTNRENFVQLRNELNEEVKHQFDAAGVEIPFPQMVVHRS